MKDLSKLINDAKTQIAGLITKESSPDFIKQIQGVTSQLDQINEGKDELIKENATLKDMVIDSVRNSGSTTEPESGNNDDPVSLEDCISSVIEKIR